MLQYFIDVIVRYNCNIWVYSLQVHVSSVTCLQFNNKLRITFPLAHKYSCFVALRYQVCVWSRLLIPPHHRSRHEVIGALTRVSQEKRTTKTAGKT